MNDFNYWRKQEKKPLFTEVDTLPPEQRRMAGRILIIGGNKGAFFTVASAMNEAYKMGAGEVRVIMPDSLKNKVPSTPEVFFAKAEASGAFGRESLAEILLQITWAEAVILIGDFSKNAETAMMLAELMKHCDKPVFMTRDAIDLTMTDAENWLLRDELTTVVGTLPQLQKLFRTIYYPKVITLSMPMNQLVEILHKFTITYGVTLVTFHNEQIIVAQDGEVITEAISDTKWTPVNLWDGELVVKMTILNLWNMGAGGLKNTVRALLLRD